MPYTKTNWQSGDIISSERLNHAEEGIAQAQQTADAVNARDSLADLTDVKITGTPSTGSLLRFGYTPDGDKWQPYTLPNYMDQWQWINETSPNENRLQYPASTIYSWLGNSNGHMYRVKIGKRILAMTEYYADLVNSIYEFKFGDVVYRATAGNEKPVIVEDGISAISDVDITTPTDGQVILYDATNSKWINATSNTGVNNLSDLSDVALGDNVSTGQILRYNKTSGKWQNQAYTAMDAYTYVNSGDNSLLYSSDALWVTYIQYGRPIAINTATLGFIPLTKAINDNNTTYTFVFGDRVYSGSRYTTPTFVKEGLSALKGINITSPTDGQVLTYDATNSEWVNGSASVENYLDVYDAQHLTLTKTVQELLQLIEDGKKLCVIVPNSKTTSDGRSIQKGTYLFTEYKDIGNYNFIFSGVVFTESFTTEKPTYTGTGPILSQNYPIRISTPMHNNDVIMLKNSYPYYWYNTTVSLNKLSDIQLTSPTDGQVLTYDATNSVWKNATPSSSGDDAPVILTLEDYTDTEGTYGTANTTYLYADDYGIITYSRLSEAFDSREQIAFKATETVGSYYPSMSLRKSNGMAYFQADNIIYTAVEENDGKFIKQNTRTEFYYKMEGRTLTGPRAPEVIQAVELGLDVKLYCDFSKANNTSTTQQFLKIKKLKLDFSYKCYNEDRQCYDYIFQAHDHVPIEYTDPTKQMSFSILYHDNSEYGSYYGASF